MSQFRFGTAISCIDGRVHLPVIEALKFQRHLDFVDLITEPGPDRVLATQQIDRVLSIKDRVRASIKAHGSQIVAVVAHQDCLGNPVSKEQHAAHLRQAVKVVQSWGLPVQVIALWVNDKWQVEQVTDHAAGS